MMRARGLISASDLADVEHRLAAQGVAVRQRHGAGGGTAAAGGKEGERGGCESLEVLSVDSLDGGGGGESSSATASEESEDELFQRAASRAAQYSD